MIEKMARENVIEGSGMHAPEIRRERKQSQIQVQRNKGKKENTPCSSMTSSALSSSASSSLGYRNVLRRRADAPRR